MASCDTCKGSGSVWYVMTDFRCPDCHPEQSQLDPGMGTPYQLSADDGGLDDE